MLYTIKNKFLEVTISSHGAELQSICSTEGTEYLWQGDKAYWTDRAPNLFPYIGRMINKKYTWQEQEYAMDIHGFALSSEFSVNNQGRESITFQISDTPATLLQYPRKFSFSVTYTLQDSSLSVIYSVENRDTNEMLFAVGGHPGFNVPLEKGLSFSDYRLRFINAQDMKRVVFSDDCFVEHCNGDVILENGSLPLDHTMFDDDAIVLSGTGGEVTLESLIGGPSVTVSYPQMPYIGFWHRPKTDAPYICIEPWSSLPSHVGEKTVWEHQADLLSLEPGCVYTNSWTITIK